MKKRKKSRSPEHKEKILDSINSPNDLKKRDIKELGQLAQELRDYILNVLADNPGHLGSNLGVIELTIALHYVFDTPYDRLIWDVGHQAYAHKILTGRRDKFPTNRKLGGISGYPTPKESEYDTFSAGHASNSISAALGMAVAAQLNGEPNRHVVAIIGDGSMTGGLAYEALNNISATNNDVLIILNDNEMSIDQNVGGLSKYLTTLTASAQYNRFRKEMAGHLWNAKIINKERTKVLKRLSNAFKSLISGTNTNTIFESFDMRYFGPINGNNLKLLVEILTRIKDIKGPKILHIKTKKGKGYMPAEDDLTLWHAPGKFDLKTGVRRTKNERTAPLYQDVFGHTLVELADKNEKIIGVTPAMPTGCSMKYMMEKYPDRSFDVGIAEAHAVTFSAGMAKEGLIPFCNIYSSFMQRAYDQLIHDVALLKLKMVFCLDRAGLVGEDGPTHHGAFDLAYLRAIPDIIVSSPMNEHFLRNLMYTAVYDNESPFFIRYPKGRGELIDWQNDMQSLEIGKGRKLNDGDHVAVLSIGPIGNRVQSVIQKLKLDGIDIAHFDMIFLKPIDEKLLSDVFNQYSHVVTVEDGTLSGGFGSAVLEYQSKLEKQNVSVTRLGINDTFVTHGSISELHHLCGIDEESIFNTLTQITKSISLNKFFFLTRQ